jgi:hypothetical protein
MCAAHRLIQEFEREAHTDGMPNRELADRKRKLVNQFNTYVNQKKQHSSTESGRGELLAGAATGQDEATAAGGGAATDGEHVLSCRGDMSGCWGYHQHSAAGASSRQCVPAAARSSQKLPVLTCCAHVKTTSCRPDHAGADEGWAQGCQGD